MAGEQAASAAAIAAGLKRARRLSRAEKRLFDRIISQQLDLFRLTARQKADIVKKLGELSKKLVAELAESDLSTATKKQINKVLGASNEIINEYYNELEGQLQLADVGEIIAQGTARTIEVALGAQAAAIPTLDYFTTLASNVLIEGAPTAAWWEKQAANVTFRFAAQVRQGLANAETNQQIIARIVGSNGAAGVMDVAKKDAAALVQSSVQTVAAVARRKTYEDNKDVINGIRQVSTLDSHTSLTCIAYSDAEWNLDYEPINGNSLPYNGGVPRHWNCRSVEVPIVKTLRELGIPIDQPDRTTRASEDGPVSATTTFDDFLKRKGEAWQNEVLGVGRADLWRAGKITLRDLVSGDGRPLTLDQLRARMNL
jgi:hypothetical protein